MDISKKFRNRFEFAGTLTKDAEFRAFGNGSGVVSFDLAQNQGYKDKEGNWIEEPTVFKKFQSISKCADAVENLKLKKGDIVLVSNSKVTMRGYTAKDGTDKKYELCKIFSDDDIEVLSRMAERNKIKAMEEKIDSSDPAGLTKDMPQASEDDDLPF